VSAYHLLANRMIEWGYKPITNALAKLIDRGLRSWIRNLSTMLFAD